VLDSVGDNKTVVYFQPGIGSGAGVCGNSNGGVRGCEERDVWILLTEL